MTTNDSTKPRELLAVGTKAPEFTLNATPDQRVSAPAYCGSAYAIVKKIQKEMGKELP